MLNREFPVVQQEPNGTMGPEISLHVEIIHVRFKNWSMPSKRSLIFITSLGGGISIFNEGADTNIGPTALSPAILPCRDVVPYELLLVLLLLSLLPLTKTASPATQAEALIEWKNSLLPSSFLSSWSSTNITNLCKWNGMVCGSTGTVSQIIISGANLNGTLAQFNFTPFLNVLSGPIPSEIGQLTELQYVSFYNSLNGTIPYQFSNLQNVWYLDLGSNYIATPDWS
ncbi:lrr receptor-like serine/threonine-protein kinase fls2 [Quercus suber]|uniref:Lrr receptor-like serine/threonine-protein kinase fls2 n=1 Tax=Quercus suber TaxID=58331 RepID=A0AAW0K949_QUESU